MDYIDELRAADGSEERLEVILNAVDEICGRADASSKKVSKSVDLTDDQFQAIKYLMRREKAGMGVMDPLVEDPYIEDISCSGVGPLYIEHKIFERINGNKSTTWRDYMNLVSHDPNTKTHETLNNITGINKS